MARLGSGSAAALSVPSVNSVPTVSREDAMEEVRGSCFTPYASASASNYRHNTSKHVGSANFRDVEARRHNRCHISNANPYGNVFATCARNPVSHHIQTSKCRTVELQ